MSGAHRRWTPEQRAAAAEQMRLRNTDPQFIKRRIEARWANEEARLKASETMARRNTEPEFTKLRIAWMHDPKRKAVLVANGKAVANYTNRLDRSALMKKGWVTRRARIERDRVEALEARRAAERLAYERTWAQAAKQTAFLMGDPLPGRSALERRT